MGKILLMIMSGDDEIIRMPLSFAKNQMEMGNEIRVVFWGPSETAIATNDQLRKEYSSIGVVKPKGCVNYAKKHNIESKLSGDIDLIQVGEFISNTMSEGYGVISF